MAKSKAPVETPAHSDLSTQKINATLDAINAKYGKGSIATREGLKDFGEVKRLLLNHMELDDLTGGGLPRGRVVEIIGDPSCIDKDTFINYHVVRTDGEHSNTKGGTIEKLFRRFHGISSPKNRRRQTENASYTAPSVGYDGKVFQNRVLDVVKSGRKECFRLLGESGNSIIASADHKFFNGQDYVRLSDLSQGDAIVIHNSTYFRVDKSVRKPPKYRRYVYVKTHPVAGVKFVDHGRYRYHRLANYRSVIEASMNNMSHEEYIDRLNGGFLDGLTFLPREMHVHHIDGDYTNDELSNLEVISAREHGKEHYEERQSDFKYICTMDRVKSIVSVGERDTYDLCMESPHNNFVANNFVVHNSGKTTLALACCAAAQGIGERAAFIDVEHALDVGYAAALEVNTDELLVSQPSSAEEALEICEMLVRSEEVGVIVLDSVAMLTTKAELDGEMGDAHVASLARLMGKALKKINAAVQKSDCIVIFINQYRMNIGPMASKTTPGGRTLPHVASIRMELRKKEVIEKAVGGNKVPIGQIVAINMKKNKVGIPYRKGEVTLLFPIEGQKAGFSKIASIVSRAIEKSIIKKTGSWYSLDDQKNVAQGEQKLYTYLEANPQILKSIKERL